MRRACARGACDRWRSNSLFSQRARRRYRVGGLEHGRAAVEIERLSWLRPRYALRDDRGRGGLWVRRRFTETLSGEIAGQTYEFERDGRRRFTLVQSGRVLMTADAAGRGRWSIAADNSSYELRRKSPWRSEMELRSGDATIGSIRKGKPPRGKVVCELPTELSLPTQAFIGFLVLTLWNRATASSGAATVAVAGNRRRREPAQASVRAEPRAGRPTTCRYTS